MVATAIIGGAATLLGGMLAQKGAKAANKAAIYQAQKQMDFQERMSSTAHQREVKDLRLAGLNPILSGTGGSGASSPSGAAAPIVDEIAPALSTALQVKRLTADIQLIAEQTRKVKNEANILAPQGDIYGAVSDLVTSQPSSALDSAHNFIKINAGRAGEATGNFLRTNVPAARERFRRALQNSNNR